MFEWFKRLLKFSPPKNWIVELDGDGFVTSARIEPYFDNDEHSHGLVLNFEEPVREGNEISHINIGVDGTVFNQFGLFSGDSKTIVGVSPEEETLELITIDTDDYVVSRQDLAFKHVTMEEADEKWQDQN